MNSQVQPWHKPQTNPIQTTPPSLQRCLRQSLRGMRQSPRHGCQSLPQESISSRTTSPSRRPGDNTPALRLRMRPLAARRGPPLHPQRLTTGRGFPLGCQRPPPALRPATLHRVAPRPRPAPPCGTLPCPSLPWYPPCPRCPRGSPQSSCCCPPCQHPRLMLRGTGPAVPRAHRPAGPGLAAAPRARRTSPSARPTEGAPGDLRRRGEPTSTAWGSSETPGDRRGAEGIRGTPGDRPTKTDDSSVTPGGRRSARGTPAIPGEFQTRTKGIPTIPGGRGRGGGTALIRTGRQSGPPRRVHRFGHHKTR